MSGVLKQGKWGVCSFVSVLNALHQSGKLEEFGKQLTLGDIQERLGAEIVTYLKMRKLQKPEITDGILKFTQSFGPPYNGYKTIDDLIGRIQQILKGAVKSDQVITQGGIGVAMTCEAVVDFLEFSNVTCQVKTMPRTSFCEKELLKHQDCIIGIGYGLKSFLMVEYGGGLKHWVYVNGSGRLCNWGSATDLNNSTGKPKGLEKFTHIYHVIKLC